MMRKYLYKLIQTMSLTHRLRPILQQLNRTQTFCTNPYEDKTNQSKPIDKDSTHFGNKTVTKQEKAEKGNSIIIII